MRGAFPESTPHRILLPRRQLKIHAPLLAEAVKIVQVGDAVSAVDRWLFLVPFCVRLTQPDNPLHLRKGRLDAAGARAHG